MSEQAELFVDARCTLGEGPFWHPFLKRLFWFDISNRTLMSVGPDGEIVDRFIFSDVASAAGIIDEDHLLVARGGALVRYSLSTRSETEVAPLEADKPGNRPNDGRVNPAGGLWIGTMSRSGERNTGALYQYRAGELTTILTGVGIPNSACFSPDGRIAYWADTVTSKILKVAIDVETGLPIGEWTDFTSVDGWPDGSVVDSEGYLWNARYGGSCVVRHAPDGSVDRIVELPVSQATCPAFGDDDLRTLYITSARQGLSDEQLEREPLAGGVFAIRVDVPGQPEAVVKP